MFGKIGNVVVASVMFFLSFHLLGAAGWAQGQDFLGTPPEGFFRIGGTITTIGGIELTRENHQGYTFAVTRLDGTFFVSSDGKKSQDTDGLDEHHYYIIDIPLYDAVTQPKGAKPCELVFLHVYENGLELSISLPRGSGEFKVQASDPSCDDNTSPCDLGDFKREIHLTVSPVLYVTPNILMFAEPQGTTTFTVIKAGLDGVGWTAEVLNNSCLKIIGSDNGNDNGTITVSYDFTQNTCDSASGQGSLKVSGYLILTSGERRVIPVKPQTVVVKKVIDLQDAILILKLLTESSATNSSDTLKVFADINGDGMTGLEEAIYVLKYLSGGKE